MTSRKHTFSCLYCKKPIPKQAPGTAHRNHCPFCLWSVHVGRAENRRPGACRGLMAPIGLTFKKEAADKYGKPKQGELMVVHQCAICGEISINRLAGDDTAETVLEVFGKSLGLDREIRKDLAEKGIRILEKKDREEVERQLFGKSG